MRMADRRIVIEAAVVTGSISGFFIFGSGLRYVAVF